MHLAYHSLCGWKRTDWKTRWTSAKNCIVKHTPSLKQDQRQVQHHSHSEQSITQKDLPFAGCLTCILYFLHLVSAKKYLHHTMERNWYLNFKFVSFVRHRKVCMQEGISILISLLKFQPTCAPCDISSFSKPPCVVNFQQCTFSISSIAAMEDPNRTTNRFCRFKCQSQRDAKVSQQSLTERAVPDHSPRNVKARCALAPGPFCTIQNSKQTGLEPASRSSACSGIQPQADINRHHCSHVLSVNITTRAFLKMDTQKWAQMYQFINVIRTRKLSALALYALALKLDTIVSTQCHLVYLHLRGYCLGSQ